MVTVRSATGSRSFQTKQNQKQHLPSNRRSSRAFKFVLVFFISLLARVVFFLQFGIFSQTDDDFQEHQGRHNLLLSPTTRASSIGRKGRSKIHTNDHRERTIHSNDNTHHGDYFLTGFRSVRSSARESHGEKVGRQAEAGNLGDGESSDEMQNMNGEKEEKLAENRNSEDKEQSTSNDEEEDDDDGGEEDKKVEGSARSESRDEEEESTSDHEEDDLYFQDPNAAVADWNYFPPSKREPRRDDSWAQAENSALIPLTKKECDRFMNNVDTSPPPLREASNQACEGYDGVLHIHHFDEGGASGAAFFLLNIGMLAWADQHNYLPWIHIEDNYTMPIWDPIVHMNATKAVTFEMETGMSIGWARDPDDSAFNIFPGKPFQRRPPHTKTFVLHGTGVWEHYFLPPNDFVPGDLSCRNKPKINMNGDQIVPGIHSNAPWAPRAWRYSDSPMIIREELSWDEWFKPQRERAAEITERYIRFNPMMEQRAHCAFPNPEFSLGMHIRHGDKAERELIEPERFLVFAEAFVNNGGGSIFLATDSAQVVESILENWPKHVADHIVHQTSVLGRTSNDTAAFDLGVSRHRTNVEALTDILALSKSTFLLHGLSGMSEAAFFLNPGLVSRSINFEDILHDKYRPDYFVKTMMPLGRKDAKNE
jgi:hypothetical protein